MWGRFGFIGFIVLFYAFPVHAFQLLSVLIAPGNSQCFFEDVTPEEPKRAEIFVQRGAELSIHVNLYERVKFDATALSGFTFSTMKSFDHEQLLAGPKSLELPLAAPQIVTFGLCLSNTGLGSKVVQIGVKSAKSPKFSRRPDILRGKLFANSSMNRFDGPPDWADKDLPLTESDTLQVFKEDMLQEAKSIHYELRKVQSRQRKDMNRLSINLQLNENTHDKLFGSFVVESLVFAVCSAFQVYFVQRWFLNRSKSTGNRLKV